MKYYETLVIVHSALEAGHLKDNIIKIQNCLEQRDGKLISTDLWGKKKLAYQINKQRFGTYILFQFSGDNVKIDDLNTDMEHDSNILSYMSVRIKENEVAEQSDNLDTQLAGHVRSDHRESQNRHGKSDPENETVSEGTPETTEETSANEIDDDKVGESLSDELSDEPNDTGSVEEKDTTDVPSE